MKKEKEWMEFETVYYDELTGLLNRRFMNNAQKILDGKISLTFFDIDNFKFINDTYGHYTGDKIIQEIGMLIKTFSTKNDYPIRFGGDEFIIISKDTNSSKQHEIIENCRKYLYSRPFILLNKSISVTISSGIAEGGVNDIESILQNADFALYCSKGKGKNCTTLYTKREQAAFYMPFKEEREIKKSLAGKKNIIVKGGFKSGKSTLMKKLKKEFPKVNFYELEDLKEIDMKKHSAIFYNPAIIIEDKKLNKYLYLFKQNDHDEYSLSNFTKDNIVRFLELTGRKATLFTVNYLTQMTNGNPYLLNRFISMDVHAKFDTLTDYPVYEDISTLDKSTIKMLKRINHLGFEISPSNIASDSLLFSDVMSMLNLEILEEKNFVFTYKYPPIYFHFSKTKNRFQYQKKMFEIARKKRISQTSMDPSLLISTGTDLYNYGDTEEAMDILNLSLLDTDEVHSLKARILISQSQFEKADYEIKHIRDNVVKRQINVLKMVASAEDLKIKKTRDPYTNILYMSYYIRKESFKMVENIQKKIDEKVLTPKENVSYLSNLANYYMFKNRENKAADCFLKCEEICKKEFFLADLGKIYMQMGNMFDQKDQLFKALEYFNKAMEIFPYTNMSSILWSVNLNLAVTYLKLGEFSRAFDMFTSLLSMERENKNKYYKMIIYNNLADAYIRMFDWENAEYYNKLVLEYYKSRSSIPDFVIFQNRKISLAKNKVNWLKLDYFNKDDIINIIDSMVLSFLKKNRSCSVSEIRDFTVQLLKVNKDKDMLYKAELLGYMCFMFRKNEKIKKYLLKTASSILLSLNLNLRENLLRQSLENL